MQRQFDFQSSFFLALVLVVMHGTAWATLLLLGLPWWANAALLILLAANFLHHLLRSARLAVPDSEVALQLDGDRVIVATREGRQVVGRVLPHSFIAPWLTIVNILPQDSRVVRSIIILPDRLDPDSFRQLRVGLRWGG